MMRGDFMGQNCKHIFWFEQSNWNVTKNTKEENDNDSSQQRKNIWLMHTCQGEQKIENLSYVCTMYMVQETMLYSMTKSNWQNNEPPCPKKEIMNEKKKKKQERVEKERWIVLHIILLVA